MKTISLKKYLFLILLGVSLLTKAETSFFIRNSGQVKSENIADSKAVIAYYQNKNYSVYFHKNKISYVLKKVKKNELEDPFVYSKTKGSYHYSTYRVDLEFINTNMNSKIELLNPIPIHKNYITKNQEKITVENGFKELLYENVYDGIDLKFYLFKGELKYDFIVHKGANYKNIQLQYVGARRIQNQLSKLIINTPLGNLEESIPEIYQGNRLSKIKIKGEYQLKGNVVSFDVSNFDNSKDLIIDPWSTFVGGVDIDECYSTFIDSKKNTYISGYTGSIDFSVTVGALEVTKEGLYDAFVTKLDTTGNILWSTYYGGQGDEYGYKVLVGSDDNPYLVGHTTSNDLLVSANAYQSTNNGSYDSFILKLDTSGNFIWATYFGGTGGELTFAASIDNNDNIVIGGYSSSTNMPTINAFQSTMAGALDAFVAKFDSSGALLWSTYCGGSNSEDVHALTTDNQNNVIITGESYSSNFPTSVGAYQLNNKGNGDAYIVKYDANGNRIFSTYFGGANREDILGLTTDNLRNIYVTGYSSSIDLPITGNNVYQPIKSGGNDAFVAKFSPLGQPTRSTFIGGAGDDRFTAAAISSNNALYLAGYTSSSDFPLLGISYQSNNNGFSDGMYVRLDTTLTPTYSTYIGGASADYIYDVKVNSSQQLTFSGFTSSLDFPVTVGVAQEIIGGQSDAFVFHTDSIFNLITNLPIDFTNPGLINVFPNPSSSSFSLNIDEYNANESFEIIIYSLDGKAVLKKKLYKKQTLVNWKLNTLQGNYFLMILKNGSFFKMTKLVKVLD